MHPKQLKVLQNKYVADKLRGLAFWNVFSEETRDILNEAARRIEQIPPPEVEKFKYEGPGIYSTNNEYKCWIFGISGGILIGTVPTYTKGAMSWNAISGETGHDNRFKLTKRYSDLPFGCM